MNLQNLSGGLSSRYRNLIHFNQDQVLREGKGFYYRGSKFIHHSDLDLKDSAFFRFSGWQIVVLTILLGVLILLLLTNWHATLVVAFAILTILYFSDLLFNLLLIHKSFAEAPEIQISDLEMNLVKTKDWPSYSVLCPLYKEWQVIPQFIEAMSGLDYPKNKLQILLILEADDSETIGRMNKIELPKYFSVIVVPDSFPKTKPKACNYALTKVTGEYVVIYDAEDVPDPDQLKKAVIAFQKSESRVVCIQAKLNFYNPHQNLLTRAFTAEYSLWFDLVLTGLQSINAPIPLGGTSNHFRTQSLVDLKGWDSFNVTEDCDLGIRLAKKGFRTAIFDSTTNEEANSDLKNWFWQRTRWVKGYIQTYLVHMRNPQEFLRSWTEPDLLTFQLVVGGKVLSMFINPLMWITTIVYFVFRPVVGSFIESFFPIPVLYLGVISLIFGNFLYMYYYMIGCSKRGHFCLLKYVFLIPFYWLVMSAAAWVAIYKLIVQPHYWAKTTHGLHLDLAQYVPILTPTLLNKPRKVII